jgi:predicted  nucleic acid-binding Zn-ribbon protein
MDNIKERLKVIEEHQEEMGSNIERMNDVVEELQQDMKDMKNTFNSWVQQGQH